jgi:hypothetical protein
VEGGTVTPSAPAVAVQPREPTRTSRLLWLAAAAAVVAVIGVLAAITIRQQDRIADLQAQNGRVIEVITAPDAELVYVPVATGGSGTIVSSREFGKAVVTMTGLPKLSDTLIYELWLMGPGSVKPAGLIDVSSGPQLLNLGDAAEIGPTVEPDGGSKQPTSKPVLRAPIQA